MRFPVAFCLWAVVLLPAKAARSTVYTQAPYSIIQPTSTETFAPQGLIPAGIGVGAMVLSSDGKVFYATAQTSLDAPLQILAIDRASGKTLRTYRTKYPIWGPLAVAPDQSKIYVATCPHVYGVKCHGGTLEAIAAGSGRSLAAGGDSVYQIVPTPDGSAVCVGHSTSGLPSGGAARDSDVPSNAITLIDAATLQVGASFVVPDTEWPGAIAVAPDSQSAFVLTTALSISVYQFSLPQMTLTATIVPPPISYGAGGTMAVSPNGTLAVMLGNYPDDSELLFIDIATGLVRQTIDGASGNIVSISPDGNLVYSLGSSEIDEVDLYVADARTGSSSVAITGQSIGGAVISPDGKEIDLLLSPSTAVAVFEEGSRTPSKLLEVGTPPVYLAVSPDGGTLYSAGTDGGLWAVSTATGQMLAALLPDVIVGAVAVSPDGATLYAVTYNSNDLMILDAATGAVLNSIALPGCQGVVAGNIAVAPGGGKLYVMVCGPVIVIDTKQAAIAAAIQGTNGVALAISPTGRTVYATTGNNSVTPDAIAVIDAATNTITASIPVGASAIAFSPDGTRAYAASAQNDVSGITVIDTASLAAIDFIPGVTSGGAESIAFTPDGDLAVVAGGQGSVIDTHSLLVVGRFPSADFAAPVVIH